MAKLTHLSLFSGVGGLDLAAEWAGFQTVGQCEWADYPTKVLEKHWPDIPRWRDIRTLTKEGFYARTGSRTVDVISGGFPCQPFSNAGKRRGKEDDRYLWPEMLRVIQELRPAWVVGENVAGIVSMALDTVLSDLEGIGYTGQAFIIPACAVDAPHRRDRCAIVAYADRLGHVHRAAKIEPAEAREQAQPDTIECGTVMADTDSADGKRAVLLKVETGRAEPSNGGSYAEHGGRRAAQPRLGGGHDGLSAWMDSVRVGWADCSWEYGIKRTMPDTPERVDRLKCLGNAVVPQQFYPVFRAIAEIEKGEIPYA